DLGLCHLHRERVVAGAAQVVERGGYSLPLLYRAPSWRARGGWDDNVGKIVVVVHDVGAPPLVLGERQGTKRVQTCVSTRKMARSGTSTVGYGSVRLVPPCPYASFRFATEAVGVPRDCHPVDLPTPQC